MRPRSAHRALATLAAASAAYVLATAGGDAARATPDRWGALEAARLVPALLAVGFFPGWYAVARLRALGAWRRTALAVLVSVLLAFVVGTVALAAGASLGWAARGLALVTIGAAAWAFRAREGGAEDTVPGSASSGVRMPGRAALVLVVGWVALVAFLYVASPELRARGDGWFHAAVASRVAQVGVPPDDPWYAGERLHYAWAMHVAIDVLVAAAPRGASPFGLLAGWSVLAALATGASLVAAGAAWARAAGDSARAASAGAWTLVLAACAVHPLGFWIWLAQSQIGEVRGWGETVRPLSEGAGATLVALSSRLPHASLAFFPDKFLIPTALGLVYAAVVLALDALFLAPAEAEPRDARVARVSVAALAALAALVLHPLAGLALVASLAVVALFELARSRRVAAREVFVACAIAGVFAAPYWALVIGGREGAGPRLGLAPDMLVACIVTGAVLLAFAWPELRRAGRARAARGAAGAPGGGERRAALGTVALLCFVAAVTVGLVQRNETKFVSLGLLALAAPAGAYAARRPAHAAIALAVALPGVAMALLGYAMDQGQQSLGARVPSVAAAEGYAWIAAHTSGRDAFLEPQGDGERDPVRDLLVHGPRPLVWGGDSYASNWGYPADELALRRRAAHELARGALSETSVRSLALRFASEGRALYAVERSPRRAPAAAKPGAWTRVYDGPAFALDRLDFAPVEATAGAR